MSGINISITGLESTLQALHQTPEKAQLAVKKLAQRIYDLTERGADKHTKTGALFRSVYIRSTGDGGWVIGHDSQIAPYASFVHWGTRPHVIKPKTKKALRWVGKGGFIFAKGVKHPGYKGDPWLIRAKDQGLKEFQKIIDDTMKGATQ